MQEGKAAMVPSAKLQCVIGHNEGLSLQADCNRSIEVQVSRVLVKASVWGFLDKRQEHIATYSTLQHFNFDEGHVVEALQELRNAWRGNY